MKRDDILFLCAEVNESNLMIKTGLHINLYGRVRLLAVSIS